MNSNVKMFITVFCFIVGAVGVVLGVLNLLQQPMAVTGGVIYGGIGLIALACGWFLIRKPRY